MNWFKNFYNSVFVGFLLSIIIVFSLTRAINSPWHRFIGGDGFGYYSYLPAKYIYNDVNYEFKWFNQVYAKHYAINIGSADDNFLVKYKDRRINKYYQGLSVLWTPFFIMAHVNAKLMGYPADGFSQTYQLWMAIAGLFYLFLGLLFLRKLLYKLFNSEIISTSVPVFLFYGSWLFHYARDLNSLTHIYSFTFITLFVYYAYCFFNENKNLRNLLLAGLCLVIIISIRPINIISVLLVPAFMPAGSLRGKIKLLPVKIFDIAVILLAFFFLFNQFSILYAQTGSFFPDTYSGEKFYFNRPKLFDVLVSYHAGLFVYVPVIFVSLFGVFYLESNRKKIVLFLVFFFVIYLYSCWWFWPITERALLDYYVVLAVLLAALFSGIKKIIVRALLFVLLILLTGYHQLKSMQLLSGILDANMTYGELFWRNFFRTQKTNIYAIPPSAILKQEIHEEDFEGNYLDKTETVVYKGKYATSLTSKRNYTGTFEYKIPLFFKEKGIKKIRFSFRSYFTKEVKQALVYLYFYTKDKKAINTLAFYVNEDVIKYNNWDCNEFGYEMSDQEINDPLLDHVTLFIWNNTAKDEIYIDNVKTEFILTDKSFEINP